MKKSKPGGSYMIGIWIKEPFTTTVGRLGVLPFKPGYYFYCGSAKSGIQARVDRHLRTSDKKLFWHIDYLLDHSNASIDQVWGIPGNKISECDLVEALCRLPKAQITPKKFGSTDCRKGCGGHLVYFKKRPQLNKRTLLRVEKIYP